VLHGGRGRHGDRLQVCSCCAFFGSLSRPLPALLARADASTAGSVRDFCLIAGIKPNPLQRTDANGDRAASVPSAFAEQLISAGSGAPVDWNKLERETRLRVHMPSGHSGSANGSRHGGHPSSSGGGETGGGSRRSSGAARSAVHARGAGGSASTKRRRDGGGNDSDSDGETTWAKALKQSEYLERLEKTETFKQRRMAEQAALNQRFFVTSRKKEEPVLGVDVNAPLLPEGMFSALDDVSVLEKVCLPPANGLFVMILLAIRRFAAVPCARQLLTLFEIILRVRRCTRD
jgi:hypothetical protein